MFSSRFINGKEISAKDGVHLEKDMPNNKFTLVIPKANSSVHAGLITIKATNPIGSVHHELNLSILGKRIEQTWRFTVFVLSINFFRSFEQIRQK